MNSLFKFAFSKRLLIPFCILFVVLSGISRAQEKPPRPILAVSTSQGLQFGAFCTGAIGGTVTVTSGGVRSSTGSIILVSLGYAFTPAMFQVTGNIGTLVTIANGTDVSMTGSNGGSTSSSNQASGSQCIIKGSSTSSGFSNTDGGSVTTNV